MAVFSPHQEQVLRFLNDRLRETTLASALGFP
jgi:hypothetical protein